MTKPSSNKAVTPSAAAVESWVFDLDNTLYPAECDLFAQIDQRMRAFIRGRLGLAADDAFRLQKHYYRAHGTTLRGLMLHHGVNPDDYLDFVHDIDLAPVAPSPDLDHILGRLQGRKYVFTNGSTDHAERVMDRLGVGHHFDAVFDIVAADYLPKPDHRTYRRFVDRHAIEGPRAMMFEDIAANLVAAAALGMTTVWVRPARDHAPVSEPHVNHDHVDYVTDDLTGWLAALV